MSAGVPLTLSEDDWTSRVYDYALLRGWRCHHQRPARTKNGGFISAVQGHPGFPDWVFARGGVVLVSELKSQQGVATPGQRDWLAALGGIGRLWKPSDWREAAEELT